MSPRRIALTRAEAAAWLCAAKWALVDLGSSAAVDAEDAEILVAARCPAGEGLRLRARLDLRRCRRARDVMPEIAFRGRVFVAMVLLSIVE